MNPDKVKSALCHHPACNGAVNSARNKERRSARGADGHTARTLELIAVNKRVAVAYLDIDNNIGIMNINPEVGKLTENFTADLAANLGGF